MNYLDAAIKILEEAGRPLSYKQIAQLALERDWIEPQKPDTGSVMNSLIMQDLKIKGTASEFSRIGSGTFTLRKLVYRTPGTSSPSVEPDRSRSRSTSGSSAGVRTPKPDRKKTGSSTPKAGAKGWKPFSGKSSHADTWRMLEEVGGLLGYRARAVNIPEEENSVLGWYTGENPDLAFMVWNSEADVSRLVLEVLSLNFQKVVVIFSDGETGLVELFAENYGVKDRLDLVSDSELAGWLETGNSFLRFLGLLKDFRPFRERKRFLHIKQSSVED